MGKRGKVLAVFLSFFVLLILLHSVYHLFIYGTGISGFAEVGISGVVVGDKDFRDELVAFTSESFGKGVSKWILIAEWSALMVVILFSIVRRKISSKKEIESLNLKKSKIGRKGPSTDLDSLYEILKEKKHLKLSTISKVYGINEDVAMSWGKTLESGNLVKVDYPLFGEPRFVYSEKEPEKTK